MDQGKRQASCSRISGQVLRVHRHGQSHTHKQFEKIVGRKVAKAALKRYEEEQQELAEKEEYGHVGRA